MNILEHKHKREGLTGTILVHLILLLLFIFAGLKYPVPRPEQGVVVDFGTTQTGSGEVQPEETGASQNEVPEPTPEQSQPASAPDEVDEDILTDDVESVETPDATEESVPTETENEEEPEEEVEEEQEEEQEVSEELSGAMERFKDSKNAGGSEGDDDDAVGDKGDPSGERSDNYSGSGRGGTGKDYSLGDRKAQNRPKPPYNCTEEGTVVIKVHVNPDGVTKKASVARGTTNTADCLVEEAKKAARKTKWSPDPNADPIEVGTITYRFVSE